jgi:hypothetical protein
MMATLKTNIHAEKLSSLVARCCTPGAQPSMLERAQLLTAAAMQRGACTCFTCSARIAQCGGRLLAVQVAHGFVLVASFCAACRGKLDAQPAFAAGVEARMRLQAAKLSTPHCSVKMEGTA